MSSSAPKVALQPCFSDQAKRGPFPLHYLGWASLRLSVAVGIDVLLLAIAFAVAIGLRVLANGTKLGQLRFGSSGFQLYFLCALCWVVMLFYENLYRRDLQSADQGDRLMKALTAGLVACIVLSFAVHLSGALSRSVLLLWYGTNLVLFSLLRPLLQARIVRRPLVLVACDQPSGADAACRGLQKLGFQVRTVPLAAGPAVVPQSVSTVVLCAEPGCDAAVHLARWERVFPEVAIFTEGIAVTPLGARPVNLHGVQLFALRHPLEAPLNRACKRCLDLIGASLLLALTAPLLAALAAAIKLDSSGPILYRQNRMGRFGHPFQLLKFRSMKPDAAACLAAVLELDPLAQREFATTYKLKGDPRVTRFGRFLRRYSLDELPQLVNVLRGEMSLVGPRPIVEAELPLYADAYPIVARVCPGMTGLWQTSGRSDVSYGSRRGFDVAYVRDWSFWRDVSILMRTIAAVILPSAY